MKKLLVVLLVCVMAVGMFACTGTPPASSAAAEGDGAQAIQAAGNGDGGNAAAADKDLTFVIVPKVVHEWFDAVNSGAQQQADVMSQQLGINIKVDYRAPSTADITAQNAVLEQAAATNPAGIAIDPIDYEGSKQVIDEIQAKGIPVILFDARVPGSGLTAIGNDFAEQAELEANRLAELLGEKGKVALMHGVTTAPNHSERYETFKEVLANYPGIEVIDGGISQDNIETAQQQAAATIAANPDLAGYLCVDAAAPIGISAAIEEAGKQDQITFVGAENLLQILEYVKSGTMVESYSTKPQMQGALSVLMLFDAHMGMELPQFVDTGILHITKDNVDEMIEIAKAGSTATE
ncbi:ribose ABC transporter substrate-binding protein [Christensenellaceae bacterium]|nr:ribose ABC transporter substrate-binding protein [Christensenellaceae bacterium]BDF59918.1 ribose ABC transporter substrate-binding protein [Christensenellaceae bacterium]